MKFISVFCLLASVLASNWDTYPSVPKTASINGFADPIKSKLPSCAVNCVDYSTGNTPCPYWDTGCLCVMPQWSGLVGECIASNCTGSDVASATSLAFSLCSSVGANLWMMPASISTELSVAAGKAVAELTTMDDSGSASQTLSITAVGSASSSTAVITSTTNAASSESSTAANSTGTSSLNGAIQMSTNIIAFFVLALGLISAW